MPAFCYLRQWGAISPDYMAAVEAKVVEAVERAHADLAPATLHTGKSPAAGASNNRTVKTWKTEEQFTAQSSDDERWLDTMVRVLHFERGNGKKNLLWYHFSAHPVCYQDDLAGPDWPGLVDDLVREKLGITPSYLQGHSGDVNAGDADHWIGEAEKTAGPVAAAIATAIDSAQTVRVDFLRALAEPAPMPLDLERLAKWIAAYREDPTQCATGPWVDGPFAADWFQSAVQWDMNRMQLRVPLSALQLGEVGLVFHPAELYSCYGLMIQRDSPLPHTFVTGYADDIIGYVPDPRAYTDGEYSAITVPKILDLPPFTPNAGRELTTAAGTMLKALVG